jgi:hypothetical protein
MYLGLALERLLDYDGALTAYTSNIERLNDLPEVERRLCEAYLLRARLQVMRGDRAKARSDLELSKQHHRIEDPLIVQEISQLEQFVGGAA